MNISATFIERPIATSLLMAAIALFGAVAYRSLPVSDLPNVDLPTLLVTAALPGASPETMAAAVATPLENWNVNPPTGTINGPQRAFTLQATGQLTSAEAYRSLVVAYRRGSPVRLAELGTIKDGVEDDKTASWFYRKEGDERSVILAIQRQPGTNTMEVTNGIKDLLPQFRSELPPSVKMDILYDRSETIKESYHDVQFTMVLTLGLIVMVIFLFLRNLSATVIPSLALPFSVIGTFAVMYLLHYSLDNLSMMALILSIGFVVADAIVILEHIVP